MKSINFDDYEVTASHNSDLLTQDLIFHGILQGARFSDFGLSFDYPFMYYDHRTGDIGWDKGQVKEIRETLLSLEQYDELIKLLDHNLLEYRLFLKTFSREILTTKENSKLVEDFFKHSIAVTKAIALHIFEYGLSDYLKKQGVKLQSIKSSVTETAKAMGLLKEIARNFSSNILLFREGNLPLDQDLKAELLKFTNQFGYLGMIYFKGNPWTLWDALEMVNNYVNLPETKEDVVGNSNDPYILNLSELIRLRTESWETMCYACSLFRDMVTKNSSKIINYEKLLNMQVNEVIDVLSEKSVDKAGINSRNFFLLQLTQNGFEISSVTKDKQLEGKEDNFVNQFVKGQVAYSGKVVGKAKIILTPKECGKVELGDIIIAKMSTPDYLPAMVRAAAFVTDIGGITSHAAIVSREMNKPCIIGTKHATQVFKDGDLVEVDANNGIVRKIE